MAESRDDRVLNYFELKDAVSAVESEFFVLRGESILIEKNIGRYSDQIEQCLKDIKRAVSNVPEGKEAQEFKDDLKALGARVGSCITRFQQEVERIGVSGTPEYKNSGFSTGFRELLDLIAGKIKKATPPGGPSITGSGGPSITGSPSDDVEHKVVSRPGSRSGHR